MGKFVLKETATGFKFDLKAGNGQTIATSEVYTTEAACLNGIEKVVNVKFGYETGDGYLYFVLPDDLDKDTQAMVNVLTETFSLFIKELEGQYPAYVKVTELEV